MKKKENKLKALCSILQLWTSLLYYNSLYVVLQSCDTPIFFLALIKVKGETEAPFHKSTRSISPEYVCHHAMPLKQETLDIYLYSRASV